MSPIVRFAPSPTGRLHIGNIRTALLNWLFARRAGGTFLLRLDDTDLQRSTEAFAEGIRQDLTWLGLVWAREERQSDRMARYDEMADRLRASKRLYACYESEDELDRRRKRQLGRGLPPIYDRAGLRLTEADHARFAAEGRRPHWRFQLANTEAGRGLDPAPTLVSWQDMIRGDQAVDIGSLSDPVLFREDGTPLYTFTSVVDDIDFSVTHVIRGEDHVTNTAVQLGLFEALGAEAPTFAHHSLLIGADGQALSKRLGSLSIEGLREAGFEPLAIACHAALLGSPEAIVPYASLQELAQHIDIGRMSRAPGRFAIDDLKALNGRLLHGLPYEAVAAHLAALGADGGQAFWEAVRGNLVLLADARDWFAVVSGDITPVVENQALLSEAAMCLPPEPWGPETWSQWTKAVQAKTGAKGRALFHPLRLALTGRENGPELKALLPLIGPERARARLSGPQG
jgi:glutamyl-tRNA synthetase